MVGGRRHGRHHQRRDHRRPRRRGRRGRRAVLWFHVDGAYGGGRPVRPLGPRPVRRDRAGRLVRRRPPQVAVRPVRLRRAPLPRARGWPRRSTPRTPRTSTSSTTTRHRGVEPERLRLPPHPAGPRAAAVVLPGRARHRRLRRRRRGAVLAMPGTRAALIRAHATRRAACASPSCRSCSSGGRVGPRGLLRRGRPGLLADQTGFVTPTTWEGETVARLALPPPRDHARDGRARSWPRWPDRQFTERWRSAVQERVARAADRLAGHPASPPGDARQCLEHHSVGEVRGDLGVVVGRGHLHHVHAGDR